MEDFFLTQIWQCQPVSILPFYTFCDISVGNGAGPWMALPHHRDGSSSWDDSQRCPMGAVDISAGADSTRAGGSSKRRRDEKETRGGNRFGPLLFPLVSVISLRRCGNNFLLLSVVFCLKMGLNSADENSKGIKKTSEAETLHPFTCHQIWASSSVDCFLFLLNQLFLCSILSPSLCHLFPFLSLHLVLFPLQSSFTLYFYCLHVIAAS